MADSPLGNDCPVFAGPPMPAHCGPSAEARRIYAEVDRRVKVTAAIYRSGHVMFARARWPQWTDAHETYLWAIVQVCVSHIDQPLALMEILTGEESREKWRPIVATLITCGALHLAGVDVVLGGSEPAFVGREVGR